MTDHAQGPSKFVMWPAMGLAVAMVVLDLVAWPSTAAILVTYLAGLASLAPAVGHLVRGDGMLRSRIRTLWPMSARQTLLLVAWVVGAAFIEVRVIGLVYAESPVLFGAVALLLVAPGIYLIEPYEYGLKVREQQDRKQRHKRR